MLFVRLYHSGSFTGGYAATVAVPAAPAGFYCYSGKPDSAGTMARGFGESARGLTNSGKRV